MKIAAHDPHCACKDCKAFDKAEAKRQWPFTRRIMGQVFSEFMKKVNQIEARELSQ